MFSSMGLFKDVTCPRKGDCQLPSCWFSHTGPTEEASPAAEYDPFTAGALDSPPTKRRKLDHDEVAYGASISTLDRSVTPPSTRKSPAKTNDNQSGSRTGVVHERPPRAISSSSADMERSTEKPSVGAAAHEPQPKKTMPTSNLATSAKSLDSEVAQKFDPKKDGNIISPSTNTAKKTITPPPIPPKRVHSQTKPSSLNKDKPPPKSEPLKARMVTGSVDWKTRDMLLKVLHRRMTDNNTKIREKAKRKEAVNEMVRLFDHELVTLALDEEAGFAMKFEAGIYGNVVKQRIHAISKMNDQAWGDLVIEKVPRVRRIQQKRKGQEEVPEPMTDSVRAPLIPGFDQGTEVSLLTHLQQPLDKLQQYGYVTQTPSDEQVNQAKAILKASDGWEKCDRCSSRFQVFPGRDEQGRLASGGRCMYHWARAGTGPLSRTDRNTGGRDAKHGCCNQNVGSDGCTEAETHVFNDKDPKRQAAIWAWAATPEKPGVTQPVSFDCEMCYTTLGMEVVRVTAISWPSNKTLLDILVRPYGEILDLNTRFSGVSRKMFAEAVDDDGSDATKDSVLRKVSAPDVARQRLFSLITPTTPLIGHAIDNDLNTLRVIHPCVVDTVLLYPHKRGLPFRQSLKNLAFDHLDGRRIQAGDEGHDSKEDATATSDLVSKAAREKWKMMKLQGWKVEDGVLVKDADGGSKL